MDQSFNDQLDQHGAWRREFALRMKLLSEWMKEHALLDVAVEERLQRLDKQLRSDKIMVAFVAEFSRGKSEMINAIFFAAYGRRIMPASAGRTTMCPTEMAYDSDTPPCLRLLPIQTRLQPQSLMEWRLVPDQWTHVQLDVQNPVQLATAFEKVAQTCKVTQEEARALGFWNPQVPEDNLTPDVHGMVEVPRWRHALINIPHPLLKQGLVILDTPGLNAIGAEPELTVGLIPQAQATVFILAADTGVTRSDLAIWREHLPSPVSGKDHRLVVLNKIDTLWDELSTPLQIQSQVARQRAVTAATLGIPEERVLAVSAQKGLVAKVNNDLDLLERSCLPQLEHALGNGVLRERQRILGQAMVASIAELQQEVARIIHVRNRDLTEQILELQGLRGKNVTVIRNMRARISQEQAEFDHAGAKIHAVRSVHLKLLKEIFSLLGSRALKSEMLLLSQALTQKGLKLGVKRAYAETFGRLREKQVQAQALTADIHAMLAAMFRQLNTEYGFSLQALAVPDFADYVRDLDQIERSHLQYLGIANIFKLNQPEFADRVVRALMTRLRSNNELVLTELELWSKSTAAQLDAQVRERRLNFVRRIEAIDRMHNAAGGLDAHIAEIAAQAHNAADVERKLSDHIVSLRDLAQRREALAVDLDLGLEMV